MLFLRNIGLILSFTYIADSAEGAYLVLINCDVESKILEELFTRNKDMQDNTDNAKYTHIGFIHWEGNWRWYTVNVGGNVFRYDYQYNEESKVWLKFHREKRTWHDARRMCRLEGATLASPVDENLKKIIDFASPDDAGTAYIGVHATFSPGVWQSIEGVPLHNFESFLHLSNIDSTKRKCAVLQSTTMLSAVCSDQHPFVCYRGDSDLPHLTECGTTDRDYNLDKRTGSCYKFHRIAQPWTKAYETCSAEGAYLSVINSDTESQVLKELFNRNRHAVVQSQDPDFASVGFLDWELNSEWYTIHGDRLEVSGYKKWLNGEPSSKGNNEFCGSIYKNGELNDLGCHVNVAFICERDVNGHYEQ